MFIVCLELMCMYVVNILCLFGKSNTRYSYVLHLLSYNITINSMHYYT